MSSGQAQTALSATEEHPWGSSGPTQKGEFSFFLFCPCQTSVPLHMGQYRVAKTTEDTAQLYLMMWKRAQH